LIALDVILGADADQPPMLAAGGTCGNVLAILSFLGWDAFPVGRLNGDAASDIVRADLQRWGVSMEFAAQSPHAQTPIIIQRNRRTRDGKPRHRYILACPECGAWFPPYRAVTTEAAREVIDAVEGVAPSGFLPQVFFFDRVSRGAIMLAEAFAERGALVMFEPVGIGDPKLFREAIGLAHVLKYSHERLPYLASERSKARGPLLEIETLGSDGLRYRSTLLSSRSWRSLGCVKAPSTVDTSGAGDWCTAGILAKLAPAGVQGLESANDSVILGALRFGQSAAAIACAFEGARGVMYALTRSAFDSMTQFLLTGQRATKVQARADGRLESADLNAVIPARDRTAAVARVCPSCL
jgi:fructokinase